MDSWQHAATKRRGNSEIDLGTCALCRVTIAAVLGVRLETSRDWTLAKRGAADQERPANQVCFTLVIGNSRCSSTLRLRANSGDSCMRSGVTEFGRKQNGSFGNRERGKLPLGRHRVGGFAALRFAHSAPAGMCHRGRAGRTSTRHLRWCPARLSILREHDDLGCEARGLRPTRIALGGPVEQPCQPSFLALAFGPGLHRDLRPVPQLGDKRCQRTNQYRGRDGVKFRIFDRGIVHISEGWAKIGDSGATAISRDSAVIKSRARH
jgi:hypothetical protein